MVWTNALETKGVIYKIIGKFWIKINSTRNMAIIKIKTGINSYVNKKDPNLQL